MNLISLVARDINQNKGGLDRLKYSKQVQEVYNYINQISTPELIVMLRHILSNPIEGNLFELSPEFKGLKIFHVEFTNNTGKVHIELDGGITNSVGLSGYSVDQHGNKTVITKYNIQEFLEGLRLNSSKYNGNIISFSTESDFGKCTFEVNYGSSSGLNISISGITVYRPDEDRDLYLIYSPYLGISAEGTPVNFELMAHKCIES